MSSFLQMIKIAIVGEGVAGISTAVAIQRRLPKAKITIFHENDFKNSCSYGPAGLFRIDNINWEKNRFSPFFVDIFEDNRKYGKATFDWYAELCRTKPGSVTGVKLLSGHIQSDNEDDLRTQEKAYGDIVYNFRWLTPSEINSQFENPSKFCIHFSAYAAEGNMYVPFLKSLLRDVSYQQKHVESLEELGRDYDVVVNCAGLEAGRLAGDDDSLVPIRGIVALVDAPWHKHFLYRDFMTFSIPKQDVVAIGSVKTPGDFRKTFDQSEVDEILQRYCQLHPAMKDARVVDAWSQLRPFRPGGIRVDSFVKKSKNGGLFSIVNHYGHGGGGFTLAWGSAQEAAQLVENAVRLKSKL